MFLKALVFLSCFFFFSFVFACKGQQQGSDLPSLKIKVHVLPAENGKITSVEICDVEAELKDDSYVVTLKNQE